jgi:hypothetical protein
VVRIAIGKQNWRSGQDSIASEQAAKARKVRA